MKSVCARIKSTTEVYCTNLSSSVDCCPMSLNPVPNIWLGPSASSFGVCLTLLSLPMCSLCFSVLVICVQSIFVMTIYVSVHWCFQAVTVSVHRVFDEENKGVPCEYHEENIW